MQSIDEAPTNFASEWGERRHMSPNDARVILCDHVAERGEYVQHFANVATRELALVVMVFERMNQSQGRCSKVQQKMHICNKMARKFIFKGHFMAEVHITLLSSNVPLDDCKYYGLFLHQRIIVRACYTSSSGLC